MQRVPWSRTEVSSTALWPRRASGTSIPTLIAVHLRICGPKTLSKNGLFQVRFHPHPALPRVRCAAGEGSCANGWGLSEPLLFLPFLLRRSARGRVPDFRNLHTPSPRGGGLVLCRSARGRVPDHRMLKYFAEGWWTVIALVDCSGVSMNSSVNSTPISAGESSSKSFAWSSRFGQAG
jgi:hypothetical protein